MERIAERRRNSKNKETIKNRGRGSKNAPSTGFRKATAAFGTALMMTVAPTTSTDTTPAAADATMTQTDNVNALPTIPPLDVPKPKTPVAQVNQVDQVDQYALTSTALLAAHPAKKHDGLPHSYFYGPSGVDARTEKAATWFNANSLTMTAEDDKKIAAYLTKKGIDLLKMPSLIKRRELAKAMRIDDVTLELAEKKAKPRPVPYDIHKYNPEHWKPTEAIDASRVAANIPRKITPASQIAAFIDPTVAEDNHISPWSTGKDPEPKVALEPLPKKKPSFSERMGKTWFGKTWLGKKLFG